ncbi:MAG: hypothetical protein MnENMB40S_24430 [Rhizobiaceae bacterium MnEN-MB40S]|nr:MAG: hypothetical protein MnENMB40S_24430 [Rhizobiaceae bacterium MnEN-MB40S]
MVKAPIIMQIIDKTDAAMRPASLSGFLALACCLLILAGCSTSGVSTTYYDVPGVTTGQILQQAERRSKYAFSVTTKMTPVIGTASSAKSCRVSYARIKTDIEVDLPRWTELGKADPETRRTFRQFSRYSEWYTQQRIDIYERHRRNIIRDIEAIKPQPSCDLTMKKAKMIFKEGWRKHEQEQRAFERKEDAQFEKRLASM